ncbi:MAG: N-6 DNA methylase, partial [Chloroflexi bacterium]|nr:N-6 DNA methylase [Chloroflexota bacterium]
PRGGIVKFPGRNQLPQFRKSFQGQLLEALLSAGVLDEFQIAGIFVNWWETVRYDLKTIVATGWSANIIPDDYLLEAFFQKEMAYIDELESRVGELDAELTELLEETEVEPEVDEEGKEKALTAAQAIRVVKEESAAIAYAANAEAARLRALADSIAQKDKDLRAAKSELNKETVRLFGKLDKDGNLKTRGLIHEKREALSEEEAKALILKKLFDVVGNELVRYLKLELRVVVNIFENLFEKYFVPLNEIKSQRDRATSTLDGFLKELNYK